MRQEAGSRRGGSKGQWVLAGVLSAFSVLALGTDRHIASMARSISGNSTWYIVLFALLVLASSRVLRVRSGRVQRYALAAAVVMACIEIIGFSMEQYASLNSLITNGTQRAKMLIALVGYTHLYYCLLSTLYGFLCADRFEGALQGAAKGPPSAKWIPVYAGIILVLWLPYFLAYFPGILSQDSNGQLQQATGVKPLRNDHPVAHTLLVQGCLGLARLLFGGDNTAGIALYSLLQMLTMAGVFAFAVWYVGRRGLPRGLMWVALAFYALLPVHAMYSITMWKDQLFSCFLLLLTISLFELLNPGEPVLRGAVRWVLLAVSMMGAVLLRNFVVYAFVLCAVLLAVFVKPSRKQLLAVSGIVLAVFFLYSGVVFQLLGARPGHVREALSIPLQQLARVTKFNGQQLSQQDREFIDNLLPGEEELSEAYLSHLADPVKGRLDEAFFNSHRGQFIQTWFRLLVRFPNDYINAFLANSYGYWYPNTTYWVTMNEFRVRNVQAQRNSLFPWWKQFVEQTGLDNMHYLPVLSSFYSIGFYFVALGLCALLLLLKRQGRLLVAVLPLFFLWVGCLFSPVHAEFRYAYGLVVSLPVVAGLAVTAHPKGQAVAGGIPGEYLAKKTL